jgi:hypothetical protein
VDALRVHVRAGSFLVDPSDWESEKSVEFATPGLRLTRKPCDIAWQIKKKSHTSYVVATIASCVEVRLHRLLLNATRNDIVDHINHDGTDNRLCNIRLCTAAQNSHNTRSRINATSRFVGVSFNRAVKKWESYVRISGQKKITLGYFVDELEAASARDAWVKENRPDFGFLNIPALQPTSEATR